MRLRLLIITLLCTVTASAQIRLRQLERSPVAGHIPIATDTVIIGGDTTYSMRYGAIDIPDAGMDSTYNGDRPVARVPVVGTNLGATTFREWLDWWYLGNPTNPSLSMLSLSPSLVEVGTSNNYTLSGTLTNPCNYAILSRDVDGTAWAGSSYSKAVNWQPTTPGPIAYTASAGWENVGSTCAQDIYRSGTATVSRLVTAAHPVLWGMSATSYTGGAVPYNIWSKRITTEGDQSGLTMSGTNQYIYILIPKSWNDFDVDIIYDHNGFNVTPSFTAYDVTVTSTGLTNNWTQDYKLYKLNNLTTANNFNYVYER